MAKNRRSDKMRTSECRIAFANIFVAKAAMQAGRPDQFGVCMLFDKNDPYLLEMKAAARKLGEAEWPTFWDDAKARRKKWPFRDGDTEKPGQEAFAGKTFINATSTVKPQLFDGRVQPITDPEEFGSGDYARALVNFFCFEKAGNSGVAVGLIALQRTRKGERLGGIDAASSFDVDESSPESTSVAGEFDI